MECGDFSGLFGEPLGFSKKNCATSREDWDRLWKESVVVYFMTSAYFVINLQLVYDSAVCALSSVFVEICFGNRKKIFYPS
jgi:hypothetical protein